MPSLRNIQEFGRELKKVGKEPEILRKRGEAEEEASAAPGPAGSGGRPAQGVVGPSREPPRPSPAPSSQPSEDLEEGVPSDIDALLASLGEDIPSSEEGAAGFEGEPGESAVPEQGVGQEAASGLSGTGEEAPEDSFLEDFLRRSDEAEETELTSLFGDAAASGAFPEETPHGSPFAEGGGAESGGVEVAVPEPEATEGRGAALPEGSTRGGAPSGRPQPTGAPPVPSTGSPGPGDEISDEELFFAVPSAADLAPSDLAEEPSGAPEAGALSEPGSIPEEATVREPGQGGGLGAGPEPQAVERGPSGGGLRPFEPAASAPRGQSGLLARAAAIAQEEPASLADLSDLSDLGVPEGEGEEETLPPGAPEGAPGGFGEELAEPEVPAEEEGAFSFEGLEEASEPPEAPEEGVGAEEIGSAFGAEGMDVGLGPFEAEVEGGDMGPLEGGPEEFGAEPPTAEPAGAEPLLTPDELGLPEEAGFEETGESEGEAPEASEGRAPLPPEATLSAGEVAPPAEGDMAGSAGAAGEELGDFSLGDIGEQFGLSGDESVSEEELNPALAVGPGARQAPETAAASSRAPTAAGEAPTGGGAGPTGEETPISLSNRDFQALQRTLSQLPRNLRIAVEELIGEHELSGRELEQLVGLLVRGASARAIADSAGRIIGRRIEIPVQYERKTGREFEEERGTFAYRFRTNILPILRVFLVGAAVLALMVFLVYRFIYNPIYAYTVYARGYGQLQSDNFLQANTDFSKASGIWEIKGWYYRYAQGFIERHQYNFAADKYNELLSIWPADRTAIFDYANMESKILQEYKKAEQLLSILLNKNMYDFQALLAAGDNYLRWGAIDPSMYGKARLDFATLLQHYGVRNEVLFRMMEYFIRTNNEPQVLQLEKYFQANKRIKVNPQAYAELGGYLIDKNKLTNVKDILFRALAVNPTLPETNFNLARYFHAIRDYSQESVALQKTLNYLLSTSPLSTSELGMLVETYDMIGQSYYREKRYLDAQQAYTRGIDRYETALAQKLLGPAPPYGKIYANLGDLNYYISGNFNQALRLYQQAAKNGYQTPELKYKEGYVYYRNQDYKTALLSFFSAAGTFSNNRALLYATANALFERSDYFAAEGYYLNLLNSLEQQRAQIANFQPNTVPADHALLVDLMKTYNNLGVTMNLISQRSADANKYSQSLVELTRSMEAYDQLTRNPVTLAAPSSVNVAYLNMRGILYPTPNYKLQIYPDLPLDMTKESF